MFASCYSEHEAETNARQRGNVVTFGTENRGPVRKNRRFEWACLLGGLRSLSEAPVLLSGDGWKAERTNC
jgi:hypothetical protein